VGRRHFGNLARLVFPTLLIPFIAAACGEPVGPAPGDVYFLDVSARAVYACAPGSPEPIDSTICGSRADTVDLDIHGRLTGRMEITDIDSVADFSRQDAGGEAGSAWLYGFTLEGEVRERVCAPDCSVRVGTRQAYFDRWPMVCSAPAFHACDGRLGDTVVRVTLQVDDMDRTIFGPYLEGVEIDVGRTRGDYVDYGLLTERDPPRRGTRYHVSIERERHYLGG
jgi:hypothetical protein